MSNNPWPFISDGHPFFPLGGQVHNSSAYNIRDLEPAWKALEAIHANTIEIPVYWEQVEPEEGKFDFQLIGDIISAARQHGFKVIFLWFGTWKNGTTKYAPGWVKNDSERFRRVIAPDGVPINVLTAHCQPNWEADRTAFCALVQYIREGDQEQTVIALQIENEPGILGSDRDYSPEVEVLFRQELPGEISSSLRVIYATEFAIVEAQNQERTWTNLFGLQAGEIFTAWYIARYIDGIAQAGKSLYDIPMYVNVWPREQRWRVAGANYPSGGATTNVLNLWDIAAPHLDLIGLDSYTLNTMDYRELCQLYDRPEKPLFIPEAARHPATALNLFHAVGTYHAIGYAVFGIESLIDAAGNILPNMQALIDSFVSVRAVLPLLIKYHRTGQIHTVVEEEYRTEQFIEMEQCVGLVSFGQSENTPLWTDYRQSSAPKAARGRGLIIQAKENEFYIVGTGFRVLFKQRTSSTRMLANSIDNDYLHTRLANYWRVEEGHFDQNDIWIVDRMRNGDETDHGIWVRPDIGIVRVVLADWGASTQKNVVRDHTPAVRMTDY